MPFQDRAAQRHIKNLIRRVFANEVTITLLGTRGSAPAAGSQYMLYGEATSCSLVRMAGSCVILDAGSGLMDIEAHLLPGETEFHLLLTHPHLDHMLGMLTCPLFYQHGSVLALILTSASLAFGLTLLPASGILSSYDNKLSDGIYQKPQVLDGNVVLLNIDQSALDTIGPFQTWSRDIMAEVIESLNKSEAVHPAVIGIDVIYAGETTAGADSRLAEAAGQYQNVVTACAAEIAADVVVKEDESFYLDPSAIIAFDEPNEALRQNSFSGHINAMYDNDGILRHGILQLKVLDGRVIPSFHLQIASMYAEKQGITLALPPTDSFHRWYVPYKTLPEGYNDGYSLTGVLDGSLPPELFADKIVLIGPYAAGLRDTVMSSIDHAKPMYGVEFQANAISALLDGQFKVRVPGEIQNIMLFVVSFLLLLWFKNRKILLSTILWAVILILYLGLCYLLYGMGYILSPLYLPLAATILYIGSIGANYIRAAMEKSRVTNTFKRYVAPEIVHEILKSGSENLGLGGKLTDIAVLFVDIRGFTTMSENLAAPEVIAILNRYLTLTSTCILQNNGTLDKFIGDATMAFWGAPMPQEDCIFKAVKAALDMVEGSKALSHELMEQFGRTVSFGIGVHYRPAVVGNIGSPSRGLYSNWRHG